jgi:hypothetical protein
MAILGWPVRKCGEVPDYVLRDWRSYVSKLSNIAWSSYCQFAIVSCRARYVDTARIGRNGGEALVPCEGNQGHARKGVTFSSPL